MPKNIVVCCDGTANEFAQNRTSVIKLYSALVHDTPDQITFSIGDVKSHRVQLSINRRTCKETEYQTKLPSDAVMIPL